MASENLKTLFVENVNISVSNQTLIKDSDIVINENLNYFLIGDNGCGKTTLLNYLYTKIKPTIDNILMLNQDIEIKNTEWTCLEYILDSELHTKYLELEAMELDEIDDMDSYEELSNYVYKENNYDAYFSEANKILKGLGINPNDKAEILSGGWRMKLTLGKFLLMKPYILFLDEPTNHLDLNAVIWLIDYLSTHA